MPAERAPMRKIREALRLKHALGLSERQIAVSVGVSRSTVAEYLRRAGVVGITWPVPEGMDDAELERRLFTPPSFEATPARAQPDWNHVHKELKRQGVTVALVEAIMKAKPHPEQGFRACLGILRLARSYGPARVEAAAKRGNDIGATTYGSIASILKNGLDRAFAREPTPDTPAVRHGNIRGTGYYH